MRIYAYNREKKTKGFSEFYFKVVIFGVLMAIFLIGAGKGIKLLIDFMIGHWVYAAVGVGVIVLFKIYISRKKK